MTKERIGGLITSPGPLMGFRRRRILQLVEQNLIPAMHSAQDWV